MVGNGSTFTRKYKPIKILKIISNASPFDEDRYVKEYMAKYGIDNVRGCSYVNEILDEFQVYALIKEIWCAKDLCSRCGKNGHFVKDCYAKIDINNKEIIDQDSWEEIYECNYCDKEFDSEESCIKHEKYCKTKAINKFQNNNCYKSINKFQNDKCYRCGRDGHYADDCYARTHIRGYYLKN